MKTGKMTGKTKRMKFFISAVALCLALAVPATGVFAANWRENGNLPNNGMFKNDYTSYDAARAAAVPILQEVADEGTALLKNDGTLPLNAAQTKVAVFNNVAVLSNGLTAAGFSVEAVSTSVLTSLDTAQLAQVNASDVAVIRLMRAAGEQNDSDTGTTLVNTGTGAFAANTLGAITYIDNTVPLVGGKGTPVTWTKAKADLGQLTEAWPDGTPKAWNHKNLSPTRPLATYPTTEEIANRDITPVRHALMLTLNEEKMIQLAKQHFSKVVIVYDAATPLEMWDLEKDAGISAIIHSGRLTVGSIFNGQDGSVVVGKAIGKVMAGIVNPSAFLVDQWDRDMTADPTWQNFGSNFQMDTTNLYSYEDGTPTSFHGRKGNSGSGLYGVDYEEGIYLGYKYYETYWADTIRGKTAASANATANSAQNITAANQWWANNVTYPFGSGLSYTDFSFEINGVYTDAARSQKIANNSILDGSMFASSVGSPAQVKTLYVSVMVKNTGDVAGKTAVQIYATAPYIDGEVEKAFVQIAGFDKTRLLQPGGFQTVTIPVQIQDIAAFDYNDANNNGNKGYELDAGAYVLRAMRTSHVDTTAADYADFTFTIDGTDPVNLKLDDYTDNLVEPLFSTPNSYDYSMRDGSMTYGGTDKLHPSDTTKMTIMSRGNFDTTFPKAPTRADQTLKTAFIDNHIRAELHFLAGYTRARSEAGLTQIPNPAYVNETTTPGVPQTIEQGPAYDYRDDSGMPMSESWKLERSEFDAISYGWTQVSADYRVANPKADIMLREMAGVQLYLTGTNTINPLWNEFMNQLTWNEIRAIASQGMSQNARVDSIEKNRSASRDNTSNISNSFHWVDQPMLARTYNLELAARHGDILAQYAGHMTNGTTGWWSPGCNLHRSPFSGRNFDYYSQDAVHGGLIIAAVTTAAEARGLACMVKHFVLNDQETNRNGNSLFTWGSEQTFRENYFPIPQKAYQEGNAQGNMQSFGRIGGVLFPYSNATNVKMVRNQWGWTGVSVTDHMGGHGSGKYDVPATPANWWDAGTQPFALTGGDKTKALDTKKNWAAGRGITVDGLIRGSQGLPDTNYAGDNGAITAEPTKAVGQAPSAGGAWSTKLEGGKGGVYFTYEPGTNIDTQTQMTVSGYTQWYNARMTALYACYDTANSMGNFNGMLVNNNTVQLRNYHSSARTISDLKQGVAVSSSIAVIEDNTYGNSVVYSVASGTLPAGLALNAETGIISGTPTKATTADTVVTIECRVANRLFGNRTVTIEPIEADAAFMTLEDRIAALETAGYLTTSQVNALISAATTGLLNETQVRSIVTGYNYITNAALTGLLNEAQVRSIVTGYNYITNAALTGLLNETQVRSIVTGYNYITNAAIAGFKTEAQIKEIIEAYNYITAAAISGKIDATKCQELIDATVKNDLTKADIQKMIDDSVEANKGCSSSSASIVALISLLAMATVVIIKKRRDKTTAN